MSPSDALTPGERRKARTRRAILEALAEVVVDKGLAAMSVQQVADRTGITHRTVYRHFPDRRALLDGLAAWVGEQLADDMDRLVGDDLEGLLAAPPVVFHRFDELAPQVAAMARISVGEDIRSRDHDQRTEQFREVLTPLLAGYGEDADAVFGLLRILISAVTWWQATTEFDLDGEQAGRAVARIVRAVVAEADR